MKAGKQSGADPYDFLQSVAHSPDEIQTRKLEASKEAVEDSSASFDDCVLPARSVDRAIWKRDRLRRAPTYSAFAAIYDRAMGEAVLPSVLDAFSESYKRFDIETARLADIGCGTGRFLKYLTRFGGDLIGLDKSRAMLKLAERRLAGTDVRLVQGDMCRLQLPESVDTLTSTFDTLNYLLSPRALREAIQGFARALKPGGTLLFDFIPKGANRGVTSSTQNVRIGPIRSEWRVRIDSRGRGSAVAILLDRDGSDAPPLVEVHRQRWHDLDEVKALLGEAGFDLLDCRPAEPGGSGDWLHVVARRRLERT